MKWAMDAIQINHEEVWLVLNQFKDVVSEGLRLIGMGSRYLCKLIMQ